MVIISVVLVYVMYKIFYVFFIIGGCKVEYFKGNIEVFILCLLNEDIKGIESVYLFDFGFLYNFVWVNSGVSNF